jgi:hypothetical protein
MAKKTKNPAEFSLPWFKFWANRWLGSETVSGMSLAEQGLFVRILCAQRVYGPLPRDAWKLSKMLGIRYEATTRWLHKYSVLTADAEQSSTKFVVPKMEELQSILKKSTPDRAGDEKRQDENSPIVPQRGTSKPAWKIVRCAWARGGSRCSRTGTASECRWGTGHATAWRRSENLVEVRTETVFR